MSLLNLLNKAIDQEYDAKNEEIDLLQNIPLSERVLKGDTLTDITVEFVPLYNVGDSAILFKTVKLKCLQNLSKFREGSPVILSGHGKAFELDIDEDNGKELNLSVGWDFGSIDASLNKTSGWQLNPAKVDIRNVIKKSTNALSTNTLKLGYISGIFEGTTKPVFSETAKEKAIQMIKQLDLNQSQKNAFVNAYCCENYYLIQGPPGTGKTWLLAHLAVQFAKDGNKVLITGPTHTSINNALQKASIISRYPDIIKVGKNNQKDNLQTGGSTAINVVDFRHTKYNNNSRGIIVGATCYSPYTKKLEFMDWDIVIFDEAAQLNVTLGIAGMVKGKKYIFIGDHKQLPPIASDRQGIPVFSKSIFEHLIEHTSGVMLNTTYRMNQQINRFPSSEFYNGQVVPDNKNASAILNIPNGFTKHSNILDRMLPEVLVCHDVASSESRSFFEAELVREFVEEYLNNNIDMGNLAIITPFRAQVRQITNELSKIPNYKDFKEKLFVDTIERIQGQERDVIIFSLATSSTEKAKQRAEFFYSPNRLNVAITRAKKKRIVIANKEVFETISDDEKLKPMISVFKRFYEDSFKVVIHREEEFVDF